MDRLSPLALQRSADLLADLINKWGIPPGDSAYDSSEMEEFARRAGEIPLDLAYAFTRQLHGMHDQLALGINANGFILGLFFGGASAAVQALLCQDAARNGHSAYIESTFVEDASLSLLAIRPAVVWAFGGKPGGHFCSTFNAINH